MTIALRPAVIPRPVIYLALFAALLALLGFTSLFFGASPSVPLTRTIHNGLIAIENAGDIDIVQPDGTGRHALINGPGQQSAPSWSADGTRLAYVSRATPEGPADIIVVDADGSHSVTVASGIATLADGLEWSPDGSMIAYTAQIPPSDTSVFCAGFRTMNGDFCWSRIFVAPIDGSGPHQIGDPALDTRSPAWSPDSRTIAFGGGNASQEVDLYVMDADGTDVHRVGNTKGKDWAFVRIDWSPDGTSIVGQAGSADDIENWDIWVIKADGSGDTDIWKDGFMDDHGPTYAPDRPAIAWLRATVTIMEDGAVPTDLPGPAGLPSWSPDGRLLTEWVDPDLLEVVDLQGAVQLSIPGVTGYDWQPSVSLS
jgi:Tol biopolymer transport system component